MELDAIRSEFEVFSPPKDGIYFGEREPRYFYNSNNQREDCVVQNARWQTWQHRQQELDAARLDNQKLREFIEYWSHDSRLMTFESRQFIKQIAKQSD